MIGISFKTRRNYSMLRIIQVQEEEEEEVHACVLTGEHTSTRVRLHPVRSSESFGVHLYLVEQFSFST